MGKSRLNPTHCGLSDSRIEDLLPGKGEGRGTVRRSNPASPVALGREIGVESIHFLTYLGKLPNCNRDVNPRVHWWLQKKCEKQWGELPRVCRKIAVVRVEVLHVLGPREREQQDEENWKLRFKGLFDALVKCGYAVDDSPKWMQRVYRVDVSRRQEGPKVEVRIFYE